MNGATALPLVRTTRPPKRIINRNIGTIQYFLRSRMKSNSSPSRAIIRIPSELLGLGGRSRSGDALYPVALSLGFVCQMQGALTQRPHDKPGRHQSTIEYQSEQDRICDPVHENANLHPKPEQWSKQARSEHR